jgi:hypothetical protein
VLIALVVAAAVVAAGFAQAYDRQPIRIGQLNPDQWGDTNRGAQNSILDRYSGLRTAWCTGVIMIGYPVSDSTWVDGTTRYWDKNACIGKTWSRKSYALIYDAKGRCEECFKIYRLRGIGPGELYG